MFWRCSQNVTFIRIAKSVGIVPYVKDGMNCVPYHHVNSKRRCLKMNGWIKVSRKLLDHWLWEEKPFSPGQAWVDLLLIVPFEQNQNSVIGSASKKGEVRIPVITLADRWGWGRKKTSLFLKRLQTEKMISIESNTKDTTIRILNYSKFQTRDVKTSNKVPSGSPAAISRLFFTLDIYSMTFSLD